MPAAGRRGARRAARDDRPHRAREVHLAPRSARLLEELARFEAEHDYDSFEASLIRVARADIAQGVARCRPSCAPRWRAPPRSPCRSGSRRAATTTSPPSCPCCARNLELRKRYVACFDGDFAEPYDALLDNYERGMTTAELRTLFDYLKEHQVPLDPRGRRGGAGRARPARRVFPIEHAEAVRARDRRAASASTRRAGGSTRPCTRSPPVRASHDIRITTRYFEDSLDGLFATMHETGHGLYEHQIDVALERTPLAGGTSLGLHESQSRMWENLVGRSLPCLAASSSRAPRSSSREALAGYDVERWYREINAVAPSLIRVEADEATYNLHIMRALRARAGAARRRRSRSSSCPRSGTGACGSTSGSRSPDDTPRRAPGHPLGGRLDRLLPDLHARQRHLGAALGARPRRPSRPGRAVRAGRVRRAARVAARARAPPRPQVHARARRSSGRSAASTIDPEPYIRYLREKIGAIYGLPAPPVPTRSGAARDRSRRRSPQPLAKVPPL